MGIDDGMDHGGRNPTTVKTNWCFVWSNSKVGKMIRRTDPMISLSDLGLSFCKDNKSS